MIPVTEKILLAYARRFPIRKGKYRLVERFGRGRGGDSLRVAKLAYGDFTMECDLRKMLQRQFYFFGTYMLEEKVIQRWTEMAKESMTIFDIGANAGIYSLAAAAAQPKARIHAFEPTPDIIRHLKSTVESNHLEKRMSVHACAVARETGTAYLNFFSGEHQDNEGMNFVSDEGRNTESLPVPTISLDDFCAREGIEAVDLTKIDVQGNEPEVLAGAAGLIARRALKTIFFELNWNRENPAACPASKAVMMLESAGYQFADPNGSMAFQLAGTWMHDLSDIVASIR